MSSCAYQRCTSLKGVAMSDTHQAEITVVGWLNFKRKVDGVSFPQVPGESSVTIEFFRWLHENNLHSYIRAGSKGPSWIQAAYEPEALVKIERWLDKHGVTIDYTMENPPEKGFAFDKDGGWIDHDPLNPCRVPPGYEMIGIDAEVKMGDIYWHPAWTKWFPVCENMPKTPREFGAPVARANDTRN